MAVEAKAHRGEFGVWHENSENETQIKGGFGTKESRMSEVLLFVFIHDQATFVFRCHESPTITQWSNVYKQGSDFVIVDGI